MAIFYFATKPDGWKFHYHFLSSRSECMWNSVEEFYNNEQPLIGGCLCDDDENIFSVFFSKYLFLKKFVLYFLHYSSKKILKFCFYKPCLQRKQQS